MIQCEKCGRKFASNVTPLHCSCGVTTGELTNKTESNAWVRMVKLLRKPQDAGIGDTIQRIAAKFGGERFKAFAEKIGIPCGCADRQNEWNSKWPY